METEQFGFWHLGHPKLLGEDMMAGVFLSLAWVAWNIYLWCLWKWSKRDLECNESDGLRLNGKEISRLSSFNPNQLACRANGSCKVKACPGILNKKIQKDALMKVNILIPQEGMAKYSQLANMLRVESSKEDHSEDH